MRRLAGYLPGLSIRLLVVAVALSGFVGFPGSATAANCYIAAGSNLVDLVGDIAKPSNTIRVEIGLGGACSLVSFMEGDIRLDAGVFGSEATPVDVSSDPIWRVGPGVGATFLDAFSVIGAGMWNTRYSIADYDEYEFRVFVSKDLDSLIDTFGGWFSDGFQEGINEAHED